MNTRIKTQVVVLGAGPAGYSAAFRCADLGIKTIIVERYSTLGGVCLNVGCIPSKALLHISKVIEEAKVLNEYGIFFGEPKINMKKIISWKENIINQFRGSLLCMAKYRKIKIIHGIGKFQNAHTLIVEEKNGFTLIQFEKAIIASGSCPRPLPFFIQEDQRIWDSTDALKFHTIPKNLLIIGGGIIGLEMGTVYHTFGSKIDIVDLLDQVIPAADQEVVNQFTKIISKKFHFMLETKVLAIESKEDGLYITMEGKNVPVEPQRYDVVLVAIGRSPNVKNIEVGKAGVEVDKYGFIHVDKQLRTNVSHIFAIGDIIGQPMLAHKGIHQGHIAAEVIAGMKYYFDPKVIPSIAYTNPELAWVGITEKEAHEKGIIYESAIFPWTASGRAVTSHCQNGMTKLIFDKKNNRIIGGSIVGSNCSELIGEICLAIEMGCDAQDIALTIHAHPTLHESIGLAAEIYNGSITDIPKNKKIIH